jgi:hypothetical protein
VVTNQFRDSEFKRNQLVKKKERMELAGGQVFKKLDSDDK